MCFDAIARPPIPAIAGGAIDGHDLTLSPRDGTQFSAYAARAAQPTGTGVVILPDVRGLHTYYTELADRFAEHGMDAVAIDYFCRTAGTGRREDDFQFWPHVEQTRASTVADDVAAATAYLRSSEGGSVTRVFTVGFCFGGSNSWLQAANNLGLVGAIGFYGRPVGPARNGSPAPVDLVAAYQCPILGLFGGADQGIPQEAIDTFDQALTTAKVPHELHVYPGAPHSFFDRHAAKYAEESADAWRRILAFIEQHTATS